ncbi:MAG: hypothetical protein HY401_07595 [Elusimicrobia bacterium]|nr:hypothetical protein [Elusimicrobiota bacterium]
MRKATKATKAIKATGGKEYGKLFLTAPCVAFVAFVAFPILAQETVKSKKGNFEVKNYRMKARKTVWDNKTGVLNAEGNVDIVLNLTDKTTAHIFCDQAQENQTEGTGQAWGNVRAVWQEVTILSDRARWNMDKQEVLFFMDKRATVRRGHATHKDFMKGWLEMDFDTLEDRINQERQSFVTATKAKGVWTPK